MNSQFSKAPFRKGIVLIILFLPYFILLHPAFQPDLFISLLIILVLFVLTAIVVAEVTRKLTPGKEDYVLIPLLVLLYSGVPATFFGLGILLLLGIAGGLLLFKK